MVTSMFARRFARASYVRRGPFVASVIVALVVMATILIQALTLSGEQRTQRDHGRLMWKTDVSQVDVPGYMPARFSRISHALSSASGVTEFDIGWDSFDIRPSVDTGVFTEFLERDWGKDPLPGRFSLLRGRLPVKAGEIAVSRETERYVREGHLSVLSGREKFTVVGVVDDMFSRSAQILAASGTAAGFSERTLASHKSISGLTAVYWNGESPDEVAEALAPIIAEATGASTQDSARQLSSATSSRDESVGQATPDFTSRFPLIGWVLSLALPLVAGLAIGGAARRHLHERAIILTRLGVPARRGQRPLLLALCLSAMTWVAIGATAGMLVGALARVVLARTWAYQPLSPFRPPVGVIAEALAAVIIGVIAVAAPGLGQQARLETRQMSSPWPTYLRRSAAVSSAVAAFMLGQSATTAKAAMTLAGLLMLFAVLALPDVVPAVLRRVPEGRAVQRLALRQLRADRARAQTAVAMLVVAVAIPVAFFTLVATVTTHGKAGLVPQVPRGQIEISDGSGIGQPAQDVVDAVRANLPDVPSIVMGAATGPDGIVGIENASSMALWALDGAHDAELLVGAPLTEKQRATLDAGGIVTWDEKPAGKRRIVYAGEERSVATVDAVPVEISPSWQRSATGIITTAGLRRHHLTKVGGIVIFTGVSDEQARAVKRDIVARGYDVNQVAVYELPHADIVPLAFTVAALLLAGTVVIAALALFRAQARSLASYLAGLVAVGLRPAWAGQVLLRQAAILCCIAVPLGLAIGVAGVIAFIASHSGIDLVVPWAAICVTIAMATAASLGASWLAARAIRATERSV